MENSMKIKVTGTWAQLERVWDSTYANDLFGKTLDVLGKDDDGWYKVSVSGQGYTIPSEFATEL